MSTYSAQNVVHAFKAEQIFEVIGVPDDFVPTACLDIVYPSGAKVECGNKLTSEQTKDQPEFFIRSVDAKYYPKRTSIIYLDPDAPSRAAPKAGLLIHGLYASLDASAGPGHALKPTSPAYVSHAGPSMRRTAHRMIFLLYEETKDLPPLEDQWLVKKGDKVEDRFFFPLKDYVEENGLKLIGGNFFVSDNPGIEP